MRVPARPSRFLPPTVAMRSAVDPTANTSVIVDPRSIERWQMFERLMATITSRRGFVTTKYWVSAQRRQFLTPLRELYIRPELTARVTLHPEGNLSLRLASAANREKTQSASYDITWDPSQGLWFLTNRSEETIYVTRSPRLARSQLQKIAQDETTELMPLDVIRSHEINNHHLLLFSPPSISAEHALRLAGYDERDLYPPVITKNDDLETAHAKIRDALYVAEYAAAKYFPTPIDAFIPIDFDVKDPTHGKFFNELFDYRKTCRWFEERPLLRSVGIAVYKKHAPDGSLSCGRCYESHARRFAFPPQLVLDDRQRVNNWQVVPTHGNLQLAEELVDQYVYHAPWGMGAVLEYRNTAHGKLALVDFEEARRVLWVPADKLVASQDQSLPAVAHR